MWFVRLLRHPATIFFVAAHAAVIVLWAVLLRSAAAEPMGILWFLCLDLPVHYLDLPILWLVPQSIFDLVEHDSGFFWPFVLLVLFLGSIQWAVIGMLFALPDLWNKPKR